MAKKPAKQPKGSAVDPDADPDWVKVRRTVKPLKTPAAKKIMPAPPKASGPPPPAKTQAPRVAPLAPAASPKPRSAPQPDTHIREDKKTRRGKVEIDRKIDLHDMTYDAAYSALKSAIVRASNAGKSVLIVVTGKGRGGEGVLKRAFPDWMNDPSIKPYIQSYAPAHQRHGGDGAWYVFLRPSPKS